MSVLDRLVAAVDAIQGSAPAGPNAMSSRNGGPWLHRNEVRQDVLRIAADSLDAAWQEAEAALPEGWGMQLIRGANVQTGERTPDYRAISFSGTMPVTDGYGPTPAVALRALAARLRERAS